MKVGSAVKYRTLNFVAHLESTVLSICRTAQSESKLKEITAVKTLLKKAMKTLLDNKFDQQAEKDSETGEVMETAEEKMLRERFRMLKLAHPNGLHELQPQLGPNSVHECMTIQSVIQDSKRLTV